MFQDGYRLFPIPPGNDSGHFANFFRQHGHVGEFIKISDTDGFDPFIDGILGFA